MYNLIQDNILKIARESNKISIDILEIELREKLKLEGVILENEYFQNGIKVLIEIGFLDIEENELKDTEDIRYIRFGPLSRISYSEFLENKEFFLESNQTYLKENGFSPYGFKYPYWENNENFESDFDINKYSEKPSSLIDIKKNQKSILFDPLIEERFNSFSSRLNFENELYESTKIKNTKTSSSSIFQIIGGFFVANLFLFIIFLIFLILFLLINFIGYAAMSLSIIILLLLGFSKLKRG